MKNLFESVRIYERNVNRFNHEYKNRIEFVVDKSKLKQVVAFLTSAVDTYSQSRSDGRTVFHPQNYRDFIKLLKQLKVDETGNVDIFEMNDLPLIAYDFENARVPYVPSRTCANDLIDVAAKVLKNPNLSKEKQEIAKEKFKLKCYEILKENGLGVKQNTL